MKANNHLSLLDSRVKALKPDMDHDEEDRERPIAIGTLGTVARLNHVSGKGENVYDVFWDSGAWTVYSESEVASDLELVVV